MPLTGAERQARFRARHPERARKTSRRADTKREHANRSKKWRLANPEKHKAYYEQNKHLWAAQQSKRRVSKKQACPAWADALKINHIYWAARLLKMEVDHIVPLLSDRVCGLHVEDNLQLLPAEENRSKRNTWWPYMFEGNQLV